MFYSLGLKMSELSDSVQRKRIELHHLRRVKAVTEIIESQVSKDLINNKISQVFTCINVLSKYVFCNNW